MRKILFLLSLISSIAYGQGSTTQMSTGGVSPGGSGSITAVAPLAASSGTVSIPSTTGTGSTVVLRTAPALIAPTVTGTGTTSATFSEKIQNSTGTNKALIVRDNGFVGFGTDSTTELATDVYDGDASNPTLRWNFNYDANERVIFKIGNKNTGANAWTSLEIGNWRKSRMMNILPIPPEASASTNLLSAGWISAGSGLPGGLALYGDNGQVSLGVDNTVLLTGQTNLVVNTYTNSCSGCIGINTRTPAYRLDVNGNAKATGLITSSLKLLGASGGTVTITSAPAANGSMVFPSGTDFSATGGTSQVVKQTGVGNAFSVGQLATTDLSDNTVWTSISLSLTGWSGTPTQYAEYKMIDSKTMMLHFYVDGTSNSTGASFTLPASKVSNAATNANQFQFGGYAIDNGGNSQQMFTSLVPNASTVNCYQTIAGVAANWTATGTKRIGGTFIFIVQ